MTLLVFSDTHGHAQRMLDVIAARPHADACIFLGDGSRDIEHLSLLFPKLPVFSVSGNCDYTSMDPFEGLAPFGGLLFFYSHGHAYHVKQSLDEIWRVGRNKHANVVLFGHTHIPHHELRDGIHLFNPGSISMPRMGPPSYGCITIENKQPAFEIITLE